MRKTAKIVVSGYVQAVGYRLFTKRYADYFHISGCVQNLTDGRVKILAQGSEADLASFIDKLREGPRSAIVTDVHVAWSNKEKIYTQFGMF